MGDQQVILSNGSAGESLSGRAEERADPEDVGRPDAYVPDDRERHKRPLLSRRVFLLGVTGVAVVLTWWAWWYVLFTNFTGIVVSHDLQVVRVLADGAAARAGIQAGDRVVAVDGRRTANLTEYLRVMKDPGIKGREVDVRVSRAGEDVILPVGVTAYPPLHPTVFGPILGVVLLVFGLYVYLRKPRDPASGLYLLISTCLFVLLGLRCHPGYLALHSP